MGEHQAVNLKVAGSNPVHATKLAENQLSNPDAKASTTRPAGGGRRFGLPLSGLLKLKESISAFVLRADDEFE